VGERRRAQPLPLRHIAFGSGGEVGLVPFALHAVEPADQLQGDACRLRVLALRLVKLAPSVFSSSQTTTAGFNRPRGTPVVHFLFKRSVRAFSDSTPAGFAATVGAALVRLPALRSSFGPMSLSFGVLVANAIAHQFKLLVAEIVGRGDRGSYSD
jgi:hypothetical protein